MGIVWFIYYHFIFYLVWSNYFDDFENPCSKIVIVCWKWLILSISLPICNLNFYSGCWMAPSCLPPPLCFVQRTGLWPHSMAALWRAHPPRGEDIGQWCCRDSLLPVSIPHQPLIPHAANTPQHSLHILALCFLQSVRSGTELLLARNKGQNSRGNRDLLCTS